MNIVPLASQINQEWNENIIACLPFLVPNALSACPFFLLPSLSLSLIGEPTSMLQVEFTPIDLLVGLSCSFEGDEKPSCEGLGTCKGASHSLGSSLGSLEPLELLDRRHVRFQLVMTLQHPCSQVKNQSASLEMPLRYMEL